MDTSELAPPVRSILDAAAGRTGDGPIAVKALSLSRALAAADRDGRRPVIAEVKPTSPTTTSASVGSDEAMTDGF